MERSSHNTYLWQVKKYNKQKGQVFGVIVGQTTLTFRNKIKSLPEYRKLEQE